MPIIHSLDGTKHHPFVTAPNSSLPPSLRGRSSFFHPSHCQSSPVDFGLNGHHRLAVGWRVVVSPPNETTAEDESESLFVLFV